MRVLVTGGCGFIGSQLVHDLHRRGFEVAVLDNMSRGDEQSVKELGLAIHHSDIRDAGALDTAFARVETIVHLAAFGSVVDSIADPVENFDVNARGTLSVLNAAVRSGVERLIFASTGGALIGNAPPPVDESSLPWPISPYGASKLCGEAYLHAFAGSYGLRALALRFGNVYGPFSHRKQGAVTTFVKSAIRNEPIVIRGDGSASRDFLYVDDLCMAIRSALEIDFQDDVLHVASGRETTIQALAELILRLAGRDDLPIVHRGPRRGEVARNFASIEKAQRLLDFTPRETLESGMSKTFEWFADNRGLWESEIG